MFKGRTIFRQKRPKQTASSTKQRRASAGVATTATSTKGTAYSLKHLIDDLERYVDEGDNFVSPKLMLQSLGWNGSTIRLHGCKMRLLSRLIDCQALTAARILVEHCHVDRTDASEALHRLCCAEHHGLPDARIMVDVLLDHGACTEHRDAMGRTVLHACCRGRRHRVVDARFLRHVAACANVNAIDGAGHAVLHLALDAADVDTVRLLLREGADANLPDQQHGTLPLVMAVWHETDACLRVLLRHGARPALIDVHGEAALLCLKSPELALSLLQRGFASDQTDAQGVAPIHTAFGQWCGWSSVAQDTDKFMSMLFQNDSDSKPALIQSLLQNPSDTTTAAAVVNMRDAGGRTPLHYACRVLHEATPMFVQALMVHGAYVNVTDWTGRTPLHEALASGNYPTAVSLVQLEAAAQTVSAPDENGRTLFHVADTAWTSTTTTATTTWNTSTAAAAAAQLVHLCLHAGFDFRALDHAGTLPFTTVQNDTLHYCLVQAAACQGLFG